MDKELIKTVGDVVNRLVSSGARKSVKYLTDKFVVRASRKLYKGKLPAKNHNVEVVLTLGRPNYEEREFIKTCKKAKEPFPVKVVMLKFPAIKKSKSKK